MNKKKLLKVIKIEYIGSAVMLILAVLSAVFIFRNSYYYLWNEIQMFGLSVARFFCEMFGIEYAFEVNINDLIEIPDFTPVIPPIAGGESSGGGSGIIPDSFDLLKIKASIFGNMLISGGTYSDYWQVVLRLIIIISQALMIVLPVIIIIVLAIKILSLKKSNTKHGEMTPCASFLQASYYKVILPVSKKYSATRKYYYSSIFWKCSLLILLLNLNVFTVLFDVLAYYFYLIPTLSFDSFFLHLQKIDNYLLPFVQYFPKFIVICYIIKYLLRKRYKRAVRVRYHLDSRNMGVIKRLPALYTTNGQPGAGKDYLNTDIGITKDKIAKDVSYNGMLKYDMMFPHFNWTMLGLIIKHGLDNGKIHTLLQLENMMHMRFSSAHQYMSDGTNEEAVSRLLLGYDVKRHSMEYCDGIKFVSLESAVIYYVQYYYVYYADTLNIANYSVRLDNYHVSLGNMIRACNDYFAISPELSRKMSHKCHILDIDLFRMFKKMGKDKNATFECGNVLWTEFDKDYGNMLDTAQESAEGDDVNSKNDGLLAHMKMVRSTATIGNDLLASVSVNSQRDMNVNVNFREISDIINIQQKPEEHFCLAGLELELAFYERFAAKFKNYYEKYNFMRGNTNAKILIYKAIIKKFYDRYTMLCNEFGYMKYDLDVNGKAEYNYFSFHKKMRADRYKTDVNAKAFDVKLQQYGKGLIDYPNYANDWISPDEMKKVHSTFFNKIYNLNESGEPVLADNASADKATESNKSKNNSNNDLTPMQKKLMRG